MTSLKKCASCERALYCDEACQAEDWKTKDHKWKCEIPVHVGDGNCVKKLSISNSPSDEFLFIQQYIFPESKKIRCM